MMSMKVVSSTLVVFLSVVVIVLSCFDAPSVEPPPVVVRARSNATMRQWQSEVAQLYQSQRENAEQHSPFIQPPQSAVQTASAIDQPNVVLVRPASLTLQWDASASESNTLADHSLVDPQASRIETIDWGMAADSARSDAARLELVAETMTPKVHSRSRSSWAWMVALIAGGIAVLGLVGCHFWDPERRFEPVGTQSGSALSETDEIALSIPTEWLEIRQTIGVRLRHLAGWGLVISALVAVVWM